jgi:acetyl esterase
MNLSPKVAPEMRAILETMAAQGGPPLETLPPVGARQAAHGLSVLTGESEPVARVDNRRIPGRASEIPVRIYTPEGLIR